MICLEVDALSVLLRSSWAFCDLACAERPCWWSSCLLSHCGGTSRVAMERKFEDPFAQYDMVENMAMLADVCFRWGWHLRSSESSSPIKCSSTCSLTRRSVLISLMRPSRRVDDGETYTQQRLSFCIDTASGCDNCFQCLWIPPRFGRARTIPCSLTESGLLSYRSMRSTRINRKSIMAIMLFKS